MTLYSYKSNIVIFVVKKPQGKLEGKLHIKPRPREKGKVLQKGKRERGDGVQSLIQYCLFLSILL
jgi:hypothetical protein